MLPALKLETLETQTIVQPKEGQKISLEAKRLERQSEELLQRAQSLKVNDNEAYHQGFEIIREAKKAIKGAEAIYKPIRQNLESRKKDLLSLERKLQAPFQQAVTLLEPQLDYYDQEQDRKRREAEQRLQEEKQKQEQENRLNQAIAAEAQGQKQLANHLLEQPFSTPTVILPNQTPKAEGAGFVKHWSAEVTDFMELVKAVANGQVPINALKPDTAVLNAQAKSLKENFNWPGVKAVFRRGTYARG